MQIENSNQILSVEALANIPRGRLLALDLGDKRVGVAVSDELQIAIRALPFIQRTSWKQLLIKVAQAVRDFDAQALVIGLPLHMDGSESLAAKEARRLGVNFAKSLPIPIFFQDERLTTQAAETNLREAGYKDAEIRRSVDSASAIIILRDFIAQHQNRDKTNNPVLTD